MMYHFELKVGESRVLAIVNWAPELLNVGNAPVERDQSLVGGEPLVKS